jgi:transcriptional regulator with XRE-family HTH domain
MAISQKKKHHIEAHNPKLEIIIGYEVKALRQRRDMTMTELAERAGLSQSMISRIEHGTISASLTTLQMLSETLSVPISTFFSGYEK